MINVIFKAGSYGPEPYGPFIMLILAENSASQCNTLIYWHLKQDNWRTNWQKGKDPREQREIRQTASRQLSGKSVLILLVQHLAGGSALENRT